MIHDYVPTSRFIAISVSESPDMEVLGLNHRHLQEAICKTALHLLANGFGLTYGGDLRPNGFTEVLFELVDRYHCSADEDPESSVTNYLAWPSHISMSGDVLNDYLLKLCGHTNLILVGRDGKPISVEERLELSSHEPDDDEWSDELTAMRNTMCANTYARVVFGGRVNNYRGKMPGIAEETLLSLQSDQPIFLIGAFGGCTRDITETLNLTDSWACSRQSWPCRDLFECYTPDDLKNGLSLEENKVLATSPYIDQAVTLVLLGLSRLQDRDITDSS